MEENLLYLVGGIVLGVLLRELKPIVIRYMYSRDRMIDLQILWPVCWERSGKNIQRAKGAFAIHVFNDKAWTNHYTYDELIDFIDRLKPPGETE